VNELLVSYIVMAKQQREGAAFGLLMLTLGLVAAALLLQMQGAGASTQAMTGKMMRDPNMTGSHGADAR